MKKILILGLSVLYFGGCRLAGGDRLSEYPQQLPPSFELEEKTYRLQDWNGRQAHYYRNGETDDEWEERLILTLVTDGKNLADFAQAMADRLAQTQSRYEVRADDETLQIRVLHPPQPGRPDYEENLMYFQALPCGFVGLQYARKFSGMFWAVDPYQALGFRQEVYAIRAADRLADIRCPEENG